MRKNRFLFVLMFFLAVSLTLTACGTESEGVLGVDIKPGIQTVEIAGQEVDPVDTDPSNAQTRLEDPKLNYWVEEVPRSDEQGEVSVVITPLNLNQAWESIDFQVEMNTHSVDLNMDLAELVTLTTDAGNTIQAISWDAPGGGHHISGMLSFPANVDNIPLLEGVNKITLSLVNVDAEVRNFSWER